MTVHIVPSWLVSQLGSVILDTTWGQTFRGGRGCNCHIVFTIHGSVHRLKKSYESASHMPKPAKKQPSPTNRPAYAAVCTPILGNTNGVCRNERNRWSVTMTEYVA